MTSNKLVRKFLRSLLGDSAAWARRLRRDIAQTERLLRLTTHDLALITELVNELDEEINRLYDKRDRLVGDGEETLAQRRSISSRLTTLDPQHDRLSRTMHARETTVRGLKETLAALKADLKAYQASSSASEPTPPPRSGQLDDVLDGDDGHDHDDEPQGPPRFSRLRAWVARANNSPYNQ